MASWRDSASTQAQHDLDELLNAALGFAQQQLAVHGEFYPFAVAIRIDGQVEAIAGRPAASIRPTGADVVAECLAALADRRNLIRAGAVVADVRMRSLDRDAIEVSLEHAEGEALRILLPYVREPAGIDYGPIQANADRRRLWAHS